jgi:hypothetical protein
MAMQEIKKLKNQNFPLLAILLTCIVYNSQDLSADDFYAYYTKLPSNFDLLEDYQKELFGRYSDLVINMSDKGKIIFSRNTSYLPVWKTGQKEQSFPEVVPRQGDGPPHRPDILSKYSHVRLIKQSLDTIIVHWRYFPDMNYVEWDGVVEEYYKITPDMKVIRSIQKGTATTQDWKNKIGETYQIFQLSENRINLISEKISQIASANHQPEKRPIGDLSVNPDLKIWFNFGTDNTGNSEYVSNLISGKSYKVEGHKVLRKKGVSGTALQFDGYYSGISIPGQIIFDNPGLLSLEGWFALTAYPFDWAPLIHQSDWNKNGFYLGINSRGFPGIHISNGSKWITLVDSSQIELFQWNHIAGVVNTNTEEISLFLNGIKVRTIEVENEPIVLSDTPMMIGLNREKMPAINGRIRRGKWPSLFGIDGLIDEVKIYNSSLSDEEIAEIYLKNKPANNRIDDITIINRELPVNPDNNIASKFGAEYNTLDYYETWDNLWRIGDYSDIVVNFDLLPVNLVFWRGTSYGPYFVTENGRWIGDQSNEDYREFAHPGEAEGCLEHMSDKQCRHSHVRIIENNDARVVIHWRYGLVDSRYLFSPRNDGWGTFSDEYWTIYPDGVAIRHLARGKVFSDGWVETMFLSAPGTKPEDNTELEAISLLNEDGKIQNLSWAMDAPTGVFENTVITQVNTKSQYRMFNIYPTGSGVEVFGGHGRLSPFHWWNHWPVSQIISDGRGARAADRLAHSSLLWGIPSGDFLLYGISDKKPSELVRLAKSWTSPPKLVNASGFKKSDYIHLSHSSRIIRNLLYRKCISRFTVCKSRFRSKKLER